MRGLKTLIIAGLLGSTVPSFASTPEAWQQVNRRVDRACLMRSGLLRPRIIADKASFPDQVPVELRIVEGYNRQSVVDVKLCVFDRQTRRVAITDGVGRLGVNRR